MVRQLGLRSGLILGTLGAGLLWLMYQSGLVTLWLESEEYGHGALVLLVLAYLVYRRRDSLLSSAPRHTWLGAAAGVLALAVLLVGAVSGISQLQMYAVWLFAVAATFAIGGPILFRRMLVPLLIVFMIIPLPNALELALTAKLQLISSELGVWFIRLFGGVVFLEGNVIDMGSTQLLVAEACAGLRYLYPLMSLGAIGGYLLQGPLWMRVTLFLSTVPITIFMNSFRIGVTGLLVEKWGTGHTEGFLHFFEGWVVFMCASLGLLLVAFLLVRLQPGSRGIFDAFSFDAGGRPPAGAAKPSAGALRPVPLAGVVIAVLVGSLVAPVLSSRPEIPPERRPLSEFPVELGVWNSREYRLPAIVEAVAGASDYFYADFSSPERGRVNLYVSYYESQRYGKIPHSPKVCIPGDGWVIVSDEPVTIPDDSGGFFEANRLVTEKAGNRVLAYYWLKQGERVYRQEILARLDLIRFSALEQRTDGALVRLVAELKPDETLAEVDRRLASFAKVLVGVLPAYVPD